MVLAEADTNPRHGDSSKRKPYARTQQRKRIDNTGISQEKERKAYCKARDRIVADVMDSVRRISTLTDTISQTLISVQAANTDIASFNRQHHLLVPLHNQYITAAPTANTCATIDE